MTDLRTRSTREMDVTATASQQRTSFGPGTASLPSRHSHSRTGSHSITGGPTNASHRVVRRKSMTSPHGSVAAIAAAVKETGLYNESLFAKRTTSAPKSSGHRSSQSASFSTLTSPRGKASDALADVSGWPSYVGEDTNGSSAVTDGPPLSSMSIDEKALSKSRIRRASEGSRLSKPDSRKAGISELRCDKCGKGYKHSSCLTKHLSVYPFIVYQWLLLLRVCVRALCLLPSLNCFLSLNQCYVILYSNRL